MSMVGEACLPSNAYYPRTPFELHPSFFGPCLLVWTFWFVIRLRVYEFWLWLGYPRPQLPYTLRNNQGRFYINIVNNLSTTTRYNDKIYNNDSTVNHLNTDTRYNDTFVIMIIQPILFIPIHNTTTKLAIMVIFKTGMKRSHKRWQLIRKYPKYTLFEALNAIARYSCNNFLISPRKHMLWLLIRSASVWLFLWVPQHVFSWKHKKNIGTYRLKNGPYLKLWFHRENIHI